MKPGEAEEGGSNQRDRNLSIGAIQYSLLSDAESFDNNPVSANILRLQVIQQAAPFAHHFQEPPARMVILRMGLKMTRQVSDSFTQNRNLHFGRAGVGIVRTVGIYDVILLFTRERQNILPDRNPKIATCKSSTALLVFQTNKGRNSMLDYGKGIAGSAVMKLKSRSLMKPMP